MYIYINREKNKIKILIKHYEYIFNPKEVFYQREKIEEPKTKMKTLFHFKTHPPRFNRNLFFI